jgi:ApaG protein
MDAETPRSESIRITVTPEFRVNESSPESHRYVFAYYITITNHGQETVQLLERSWIVTDANQQVQRVQGKGVIGLQPLIAPGETFSYDSAVLLETAFGTLEGAYTFRCQKNQQLFNTPIPAVTLAKPKSLH